VTRNHAHKGPEGYAATSLRVAKWPEDLDTVRRLLQEYRAWLSDHVPTGEATVPALPVGLRRIDEEISGLPGVYGRPRGEIVLAFRDGELVACGALREFEPKIGEIRRVYVRADHRGPGFGPVLTRALLDQAHTLGFERVRVDTLPTMSAAIQFYQDMGFRPIPSYWPHPVPGALFFEIEMSKVPRR
jgi:GNAT superfamily N-acetyltransferase